MSLQTYTPDQNNKCYTFNQSLPPHSLPHTNINQYLKLSKQSDIDIENQCWSTKYAAQISLRVYVIFALSSLLVIIRQKGGFA